MLTSSQSEHGSHSPVRHSHETSRSGHDTQDHHGFNRQAHSDFRNQSNSRPSPYPGRTGDSPPARSSRTPGFLGHNRSRESTNAGHQAGTAAARGIGANCNAATGSCGVNQPWPPTVVPFNPFNGEFNDEFVRNLGQTFDHNAPYTAFVEELVMVPQPRQYAILLYSVLSVRQSIESLIRTRDEAREAIPALVAIPLSLQARMHTFQRFFRTFVQSRAKEILLDPTLEIYSCEPVRGAPPAGRSLLEQVLDHVRTQSEDFKRDYLPPGYIDQEPAAEASVNSELRDRIKHEQGAMHNMLPTMVHDPQGRPITHPVPTLTNLIIDVSCGYIFEGLQAVYAGLPADMSREQYNWRVRTRVAYLRIQTIYHYARPAPGNVNRQWALVDEQLQALRAKDGPYRRAFFRLIMELDQATFGDKFFTEMDVDSIRPPTEEEVLAKMELMAAEQAAGGAGNDGAAAI
ncbi:hypothetical protein PTTG_29000 [Puccinia triticina 1-1 BBBD Race 1]|uniref:Uncharacterized protein n=1 Tax=Puccinia triticina (isolate 1-1 / race 1 (BBBD)) TaxID=630390 RepID=A0A180G788_PUCT1|nr:hypothetical protein PTTG_29000 [Puccinia triticina 1-1 BBBD Race 1]